MAKFTLAICIEENERDGWRLFKGQRERERHEVKRGEEAVRREQK